MTTFEVGDKVRLKQRYPRDWDYADSRQRIVMSLEGEQVLVTGVKHRITGERQPDMWVHRDNLAPVKRQVGDFVIGGYRAVEFAHTSPEAEAAWLEYKEVFTPLQGRNGPSKREFLAGFYYSRKAGN